MSAKVLMLASGKGGTGKSTVSVLLGAKLAARGHRVLLVELDSGLRSVDVISGVYGKTVYDVEDILSGRCRADKAVAESPLYPNLAVISAPYSGGTVQTAPLAAFLQQVHDAFDFILLDTAAGMGSPFEAAAAVAHLALLVITPDPVTLRDGRIVSDALYEH
ncbi:MAG: AAA family ATPase, partial [Ruthenibacterium sp.]